MSTAKNSRLGYTPMGQTVDELRQDIQTLVYRLADLLDQDAGIRGTPTFHASLDLQGHQIKALAKATKPDEAVRFDQFQDFVTKIEEKVAKLEGSVTSSGEGLTRPSITPLEVETSGSVGTYNGRGANEAHVHPGMNLTDAQTVGGIKTFSTTLILNGDLDHNGTNIGLHGAAPVPRSTGWVVVNGATDTTLDVTGNTLPEVAAVLGTLITFLLLRGDLSA